MEVLFFLVPISLFLIAIAALVMRWAVRSGQYDDLEGPAHSILYDDDEAMIPPDARRPTSSETPGTSSAKPPAND